MEKKRIMHKGDIAYFILILLIILAVCTRASAHGDEDHPDVEIHTFKNGETWTSCSFQIHKSLTQNEFHDFTKQAGGIIYFQPMSGASHIGKHHFEVSLAGSRTPIDQTLGAWNNTFAHPETDLATEDPHWLGDQVVLPNIRARYGLTKKWELGGYFTKDPNANYGFYGWDLKRSKLLGDEEELNCAIRFSHAELFGPEDMKLRTNSFDLLMGKQWEYFEFYGGIAATKSVAREKSDQVDLKREKIWSPRALVGAKANYKFMTVGVEYDRFALQTISFKLGVVI